jgi:hypothetical protein
VIYSTIICAWPTVILNVCLAAINSYHLIRTHVLKPQDTVEE